MKKSNQFLTTLLTIAILLMAGACNAIGGQDGETIHASGVIEVMNITLSSEVSGRVSDIFVEQGDEIEHDQALLQLESDLLEAQHSQAEAELAMAQAAYTQIKAASEIERLTAQQVIDDLYANVDVARAEKKLEIANLQDAVDDAQRRVSSIMQGGKKSDINSARANVILLADQLDDARENYQDFSGKSETNLARASSQLKLSEAQGRYDVAVRLLNNLEADPNDIDLAIAEANLLLLQSRLLVSESDLEDLADGPSPDALSIAEAALATALSNVALAQSQVDAAQASVELLQVQINKTSVQAPFSGLVLNRLAEIGELVFPGTPLMQIADTTDIRITVFIPEDKYGRINVGDVAELSVDSFPDQTFVAKVSSISNQAEYTPRNVQTEEDRRTTVFAIELTILDDGGKLKSGMPGDVVFEITGD